MQQKRNFLPEESRPLIRRIQVGLLSVILIFVFGVSIWNASELRMAMNRSTRSYLDDVTTNLSRDIQEAIHNKMSSLIMVADSVMRMDIHGNESSVRDYLARKAEILEFDPLILLDRKGDISAQKQCPRIWTLKASLGYPVSSRPLTERCRPVTWVGKVYFILFLYTVWMGR